MKKDFIFLFVFFVFLILSCSKSTQKKIETVKNIDKTDSLKTKTVIDSIKKVDVIKPIKKNQKDEMFCIAINHFSTAPFYVVIKVKNLKNGQVKELCTEAPFVLGAIDYQYDFKNLKIDCDKYPNQYFRFSTKKALNNIGFNLYTIQELEEYSKTINIELILQHVKEGKLKSRSFGYDYPEFCPYLTNPCSTAQVISEIKENDWDEIKKEQRMFAHIMYNNGIMMTRGCVAGNTCELYTIEQARNIYNIP